MATSTVTVTNPSKIRFLFIGTSKMSMTATTVLTGSKENEGLIILDGQDWEVFIPYGNFNTPTAISAQDLLATLSNSPVNNIPRTVYSYITPVIDNQQTSTSIVVSPQAPAITLAAFATLFVPIAVPLSSSFDINTYFQRLAPSTSTANSTSPSKEPVASPSSATTVSSTTSQTLVPSNEGDTPTTSLSQSDNVTPGATTSTTSPTFSPSSTANTTTSGLTLSQGGLAGLIIGVSVLGLLLGLLACFVWGRKRSTKKRSQARSRSLNGGSFVAGAGAGNTHELVEPNHASGWQKHLAQGADDSTVMKAVASVFERIEPHIEEYYGTNPASSIPEAFDSLRVLSPKDFSKILPQSIGSQALLKGMLARCIVHDISLEADSAHSLLPHLYTDLPTKIKWHMEQGDDESGCSSEVKPGFAQAMSTWRVLIGFLVPRLAQDEDFKRSSDSKIRAKAEMIEKALSPWRITFANGAARNMDLQQILRAATDLGLLLFTHPETFTFNWKVQQETKGQARAVVLFPSFEKRLGEFGRALPHCKVLVPSKQVLVR